MVVLYEKKILEYINRCFEDINIASYADNVDTLLMKADTYQYPSFYYSREAANAPYPVKYPFMERMNDGSYRGTKFFRVEVNYNGSILVESQQEAWDRLSRLRFFINDNPYIIIPWQELGDAVPQTFDDPTYYQDCPDQILLPVQIRLLYMKIESHRDNQDEKGALRTIDFGWRSDLFISENFIPSRYTKIRIRLNDQLIKTFELE